MKRARRRQLPRTRRALLVLDREKREAYLADGRLHGPSTKRPRGLVQPPYRQQTKKYLILAG